MTQMPAGKYATLITEHDMYPNPFANLLPPVMTAVSDENMPLFRNSGREGAKMYERALKESGGRPGPVTPPTETFYLEFNPPLPIAALDRDIRANFTLTDSELTEVRGRWDRRRDMAETDLIAQMKPGPTDAPGGPDLRIPGYSRPAEYVPGIHRTFLQTGYTNAAAGNPITPPETADRMNAHLTPARIARRGEGRSAEEQRERRQFGPRKGRGNRRAGP